MNEFFIQYGYFGMALASFLAGTFVPFSSEAVMGVLIATTGMDPWLTLLSATIGNVLGSMFNYFIGRIGNIQQISRWMRVKEDRLAKTQEYVAKKGSWIAFFSFLPFFGTCISIALGLLRANILGVFLYSSAGKLLRYIIVAFTAAGMR